jgi:hypothetical protein
MCVSSRACIGTNEKARISFGLPTKIRLISTHDDTIIRIVVATLDVIIGRATIGTILTGRSPF